MHNSTQLEYAEMVEWVNSKKWATVLYGYEQIEEYPGGLPIDPEPYHGMNSGIQETHLDAIRSKGWVVKNVYDGTVELKPDPRATELAELKAEFTELVEQI